MTTDNKTLADVQPGGRVRLGDQAERARFEAWPQAREFEIQKDGSGEYLSEVTHGAWLAWKYLSAQPSPGGQGVLETVEELAELNRTCAALDPDYKGPTDAAVQAVITALAARQPVRSAPEWFELVIRDVCELDPEDPDAADTVCIRLLDLRLIMERYVLPAQAVDLGAVREAVRKAWQKCAAGESVDLQFGTLLALIDSMAVGK